MVIKPHEILNHPTHLLVGSAAQLQMTVMTCLQELLCPQKGCTYCSVCQGVYTKSSASLLWLEPENNYTRDMIQPIFEVTALQRTAQEPFFIVIARAERLQHASANALLKILEEPPAGYYFLLMTTHERLVLPTIFSRAILHRENYQVAVATTDHQLVAHFTGATPLNPAAFLQLLDTIAITEQESHEQLDTIMQRVHRLVYKKTTKTVFSATDLRALVTIYEDAMLMPPQPGSSKIFWKDLYLQTMPYYKTLV